MKLELGSEGSGSSNSINKCHSIYSATTNASSVQRVVSSLTPATRSSEEEPRGNSPVIKNGFSGSIFTRKISKKNETTRTERKNSTVTATTKTTADNELASDYFKSTYGHESSSEKMQEKNKSVESAAWERTVSKHEAGSWRGRSLSKTLKSPDRGSSMDPLSSKDSTSRYSSFSYLNLLPADGSFPHRTQSIGDPVSKSRRNSDIGGESGPLSQFTGVTSKSNFMVRSNPIGLAEPSNKKDGYAVGKDGSLYRSSENLFVNSSKRDLSKDRSASVTPKDSSWKERRSSWNNTANVGIGLGRGLIETGKPARSIFMPFGSTKGAIKSYIQKHMAQTLSDYGNSSLSNLTTGFKKKKNTSEETSVEAENIDISKNIEEIKSLTESHVSYTASTTTLSKTSSRHSERKSRKGDFEEKKHHQHHSTASSSQSSVQPVGMAFKELDVSLKAIPFKEDVTNVTLTSNRRRTLSLTKSSANNLPEESVTISLPGSRRTSRNPSLERKQVRHDSSVEIFRGSFEVIVGSQKNKPVKVKEISSEVILIKGDCEESESTNVILHIDSGKQGNLRENVKENTSQSKSQLDSLSMQNSNLTLKQEHSQDSFQNILADQTICTTGNTSSEAITVSKRNKDTLESSLITPTINNDDKLDSSVGLTTQNKAHTQNINESLTCQKSKEDNVVQSLKSETSLSTEETTVTYSHSLKSVTTKSNKVMFHNGEGVGNALKGLDVALEALAKERNAANSDFAGSKLSNGRRSRHVSCTNPQGVVGGDSVLNVTVSLPASRRVSRCPSSDRCDAPFTSRRSSMDLYTADYNMKLHKDGKNTLEQTSVCHIKVDERNKDTLNLCGRCHNMNHSTSDCTEFGTLKCPRCLQWDHWEDTCPTALISTECSICETCGSEGHVKVVHEAKVFPQRRCIVDMLGWEGFREWFYEDEFRSWWQLNGFVGVPLYKIYKRTTEWRLEPKVEEQEEKSSLDCIRGTSSTRAKGGYLLSRDDSIDELMKSVYKPRRKIETIEDNDDSGRSTPDYLKKYPGSEKTDEAVGDASDSELSSIRLRKRRTFSETLRMLDDDILAELNIK